MVSVVDHLMIAADDLAASRQQLATAGLIFADGGRHPFGTVNALAVSPQRHAYLELISAESQAEGDLAAAVRRGGLVSYAVGVDDIDAAIARLTNSGVAVSPVTAGERRAADGRRVHWRTATIADGFARSELPFLIEWPAGATQRTGLTPSPSAPHLTELRIGSADPVRLSALFDVLDLDLDGEVRVDVTAGAGLGEAMVQRPDGTSVVLRNDPATRGVRIEPSA